MQQREKTKDFEMVRLFRCLRKTFIPWKSKIFIIVEPPTKPNHLNSIISISRKSVLQKKINSAVSSLSRSFSFCSSLLNHTIKNTFRTLANELLNVVLYVTLSFNFTLPDTVNEWTFLESFCTLKIGIYKQPTRVLLRGSVKFIHKKVFSGNYSYRNHQYLLLLIL